MVRFFIVKWCLYFTTHLPIILTTSLVNIIYMAPYNLSCSSYYNFNPEDRPLFSILNITNESQILKEELPEYLYLARQELSQEIFKCQKCYLLFMESYPHISFYPTEHYLQRTCSEDLLSSIYVRNMKFVDILADIQNITLIKYWKILFEYTTENTSIFNFCDLRKDVKNCRECGELALHICTSLSYLSDMENENWSFVPTNNYLTSIYIRAALASALRVILYPVALLLRDYGNQHLMSLKIIGKCIKRIEEGNLIFDKTKRYDFNFRRYKQTILEILFLNKKIMEDNFTLNIKKFPDLSKKEKVSFKGRSV